MTNRKLDEMVIELIGLNPTGKMLAVSLMERLSVHGCAKSKSELALSRLVKSGQIIAEGAYFCV